MNEDYRLRMPRWMPTVGLVLYLAIGGGIIGGIAWGIFELGRLSYRMFP